MPVESEFELSNYKGSYQLTFCVFHNQFVLNSITHLIRLTLIDGLLISRIIFIE